MKHRVPPILAILASSFYVCGLGATAKAQKAHEADSLVLVEFYEATNGDNWTDNSGWLQAPVVGWSGIRLSGEGRVIVISLTEDSLSGFIPSDLGNLAELSWLWLIGNNLSGPIPSELGNLSKLEMLRLNGRQLSGPIPPELGKLTELRYLLLSRNQLSGPIPPELGRLMKLERMRLSTNQLSGSIPPELGSLSALDFLVLSDNQLSGTIPPELGNLSALNSLGLSYNQLVGTIPPSFSNLAKLEWLSLGNNQLSDPMLLESISLPGLQGLGLEGNHFDELPDLTGLPHLNSLNISYNRLSFEDLEPHARLTGSLSRFEYAPQASININIQRTSTEQILTLSTGGSENRYQWFKDGEPIPGATGAELRVEGGTEKISYSARVTNPLLPELTLWTPGFGGKTPASTTDSLALVKFFVSTDGENWIHNVGWLRRELQYWMGVKVNEIGRVTHLLRENSGLNGAIPAELGQLAWLESLDLCQNKLDGRIPRELGRLSRLGQLCLHDNQLSGPIPRELGQLASVQILDLSRNQLDGPIPSELGRLGELQELILSENELTGSIPRQIGNLDRLFSLILNDNDLAGSIPHDIGNLKNLTELRLNNNKLSGSIPPELGNLAKLGWLGLHHNQITGPIPGELGNLAELSWLGLHHNQLSGPIPGELGNLAELSWLGLHHNQVTGPIPDEFNNLKSLNWAYFSHNLLDGMPNFTGHPSLWLVDVAHNRLSFEDLEPNAAIINKVIFNYAPQDSIDTHVKPSNNEYVFTVATGGSENRYQWYWDDEPISGEIAPQLRIPQIHPDAYFHATVANPNFHGLTLISRPRGPRAAHKSVGNDVRETVNFALHPNYPNPVVGITHIQFDVERLVPVRLQVYDTLGRLVRTLVNEHVAPGRHRVVFDATGLAPGLYHCQMQAGDLRIVQPLTVLR